MRRCAGGGGGACGRGTPCGRGAPGCSARLGPAVDARPPGRAPAALPAAAAGSRSEPRPIDPAGHGWGWWARDVVAGLGLLPPPGGGGRPAAAAHVGMSMGAAVAMDLAAVAPEAVGAAVLIVPICLDPGAGGPRARPAAAGRPRLRGGARSARGSAQERTVGGGAARGTRAAADAAPSAARPRQPTAPSPSF
jgi:pimeloyl-ACP methyl ester carboxylesterase